jgi:hypothetical protein
MKKEYGLYPAKSGNNENYDKGTNQKTITFKGVQQGTGIVTNMTITGAKELIEKEFLNFPLAKGIPILVVLDNSQQTIATTLIQAAKKKAKDAQTTQTTMTTGTNPPEQVGGDGEKDADKEEEEKGLTQLANEIGTNIQA